LACALLAARVARALGGDEADGQDAMLWLAWNPLLVIESAVSGHIEPIMMCLALAGILVWRRGRTASGAAILVASTLTKWVTAPLLLFGAVRELRQAQPGRRLRPALV